MSLTRRDFLKLGLLGGAFMLLPMAPAISTLLSIFPATSRFLGTRPKPSPRIAQFALPLTTPPVLQPVRTDATADFYEITQKEARVEILPGLVTTIWGYNGQFPGPTFRVRSGRQIVVKQTNLLPEAMSVHQHGGVTPPDSDGYPTDLIPPGGSREYRYPNDRPAATMWYHDHAMDTTGHHIYMGLAGFYICEDDFEDGLGLPKGDHDIPLLIQDRRFTEDGSLDFRPLGNIGVLNADVMLVNGVPWPRFEVANRRYRFRILNGSNATPLILALSSGQPLMQIATDSGLLPAPVSSASIPLGVAERVDVVIDFSAYPIGSQLILENRDGEGRMAQIMRFDVVRTEADDSSVPATLRPVQPLSEQMAVRTREFVFGPQIAIGAVPPLEWGINGKQFDPNRIDARPRLGDVEIWRLTNRFFVPVPGIGIEHPVHIHLANFQILDRNGKKPAPHESGWKDTICIPPAEEARIIMRFEAYRGKYIMHCHNLEHEDMSMMTNFEVI